MQIKQYFYKDKNGGLKKYHYCCRCSAGPFKDADVDKSFVKASSLTYCIDCFNTLFPKAAVKKILNDGRRKSSLKHENAELLTRKIWNDLVTEMEILGP